MGVIACRSPFPAVSREFHAVMGFHAQTLEIFDAPFYPRRGPKRCIFDNNIPENRPFGNVVEPPSRKSGCGRSSDDACQTSFSGKLAEMAHPRAKIRRREA